MAEEAAAMKKSARDSFFIYERLRRIFLLGLRMNPILRLVDGHMPNKF